MVTSVPSRVRGEAEHQAGRERPRLAAEVVRPRRSSMPTSSRTSRRTAASSDSPGSTKPASVEKRPSGQVVCRPSSSRSSSSTHEHDDRRVGPRVVLAAVGHAPPGVPGVLRPGRLPAPRAVRVGRVPVREGHRVHDETGFAGVEQRTDLAQPEVGRCVLVAGVERVLERREERGAVVRCRGSSRRSAGTSGRRSRSSAGAVAVHGHPAVTHQHDTARRVGPGAPKATRRRCAGRRPGRRRRARAPGRGGRAAPGPGGPVRRAGHLGSDRASSSHRWAAASAPLSSNGISTFSFGACQPSSGRLTPRKTTGAPVDVLQVGLRTGAALAGVEHLGAERRRHRARDCLERRVVQRGEARPDAGPVPAHRPLDAVRHRRGRASLGTSRWMSSRVLPGDQPEGHLRVRLRRRRSSCGPRRCSRPRCR